MSSVDPRFKDSLPHSSFLSGSSFNFSLFILILSSASLLPSLLWSISPPNSSIFFVNPALATVPRFSCFFHFVLLFWNQILTCCSVTHNSLKEQIFSYKINSIQPFSYNLLRWDLSVALRYFLVSNIFSMMNICRPVKVVLIFFCLPASRAPRLRLSGGLRMSSMKWGVKVSRCLSANWLPGPITAHCSAPLDGRLITKRRSQAVSLLLLLTSPAALEWTSGPRNGRGRPTEIQSRLFPGRINWPLPLVDSKNLCWNLKLIDVMQLQSTGRADRSINININIYHQYLGLTINLDQWRKKIN